MGVLLDTIEVFHPVREKYVVIQGLSEGVDLDGVKVLFESVGDVVSFKIRDETCGVVCEFSKTPDVGEAVTKIKGNELSGEEFRIGRAG